MFSFEKYGNSPAVITEEKIYTYNDLHLHCQKFSRCFSEKKLIFCFCENNIGSLIAYLSMINSRHTVALFKAKLINEYIDELLVNYAPEYLYVPKSLLSHFKNCEIVYEQFDGYLLKTNFSQNYLLYPDLALLLSTSGSTGSPKFVRQSFENIYENTLSIIEYLHINASERAMVSLPMNYTYGLSIINTHLYSGASIILTDHTVLQKEFWTLLKDHKATSLSGIPYTFEMLDKLRIEKMKLPHLKTLTQAGGKLSYNLHMKFAEWAKKTNKNFVVMYGQTEASPRMGYLEPDMAITKAGSIGKAIHGGTFFLINENGEKIESPDTVGELVYTGKNVALGYAQCGEDLKLGDIFKGCLYTGDMAKTDQDGFYYIVGRKKRFLKLFGNRVNLDECEQVIRNKFNIECACIGNDDCLIVLTTADINHNQIISLLETMTLINHKAFIVKQITEIPKNESGKILYSVIEKQELFNVNKK